MQEAQAIEFLAGPARGRDADIALGDFNSAADGGATHSYAAPTKRFGGAWLANDEPGWACCQDQKQTNPTSKLATRIDLVLSRWGAKAVKTRRVGVTPLQTSPRLLPSDHAGVVRPTHRSAAGCVPREVRLLRASRTRVGLPDGRWRLVRRTFSFALP